MCWDDDHIKLSRNRVGIEIGIGKYHIKMKKKIQTIFKILGVIGQFVGVERSMTSSEEKLALRLCLWNPLMLNLHFIAFIIP